MLCFDPVTFNLFSANVLDRAKILAFDKGLSYLAG